MLLVLYDYYSYFKGHINGLVGPYKWFGGAEIQLILHFPRFSDPPYESK